MFDLQLFNDGLDDNIAVTKILQTGCRDQALLCCVGFACFQLSLFRQPVDHFDDEGRGFVHGLRIGIKQTNLHAAGQGNLGDATAHGPGTDDADFKKGGCV